jgi:hypothetical protein
MALLFLGIFTVTLFVVGVRLLSRGLATRARPELLLGAHTVLVTLGNVVIQGAVMVGLHGTVVSDVVVRLGGTIVNAGYLAFAWFCVEVYRPEMPWLRKVCGALTLAILAVQPFGVMYARAYEPVFYAEFAFRVSSYAWGSYEAFRFYAVMQRRTKYGMGDPMVQNRFLLWGIATSLALLILIAMEITFMATALSELGSRMLTASAILSIPTAISVWITFFPPDWYRKRIEQGLEIEVT